MDEYAMDYSYLVLKFIVGGGVIVGVTFLAQQVDAKYAGILIAAPILTLLAFLFTYSESGLSTSRQLVIGAFWFAIPTLLFLLALYLLLARYPVGPSLGGAFGVWFVAILAMNQILYGAWPAL
nr:GlpM family protein [uncultured Methanoregula sp.]